jgi:hypothetical protein
LVGVVLLMLYIQGAQSDRYFGWNNPKRTVIEHTKSIVSDGSGYYAYLPAWFIYDDIHFDFLDDIHKKYETNNFIQGIGYNAEKKVKTDKYYIGTSLLISPFFLVNHGINKILYDEADGYSKSYQFTVSLAALFYWLLGIIGLIKVLRLFSIPNFPILLTLILLTFGTFGNYYTVYNPSFSHVYSFCIITWFFYFAKRLGDTQNYKFIIHLSVLLGFIFLLRPTNVLVVLMLPFFFENRKVFTTSLVEAFRTKKILLGFSFVIFGLAVFSQIYTNYCQIGEWKLNTYNEEGFDYLLDPQFFNVLFSYRKGLFTYAPILILVLPGFYFLFKKHRYFAWGWFLVSFVILYITASWWCWYYGGGLGMRPYFDLFVLLAIPMALFVNYMKGIKGVLVLGFSVLSIYYYQVVQVQMNQNILHYSEMNKKDYWRIFLKTDARFNWMLHIHEDELPKRKANDFRKYFFNPDKLDFESTRSKSFTHDLIQEGGEVKRFVLKGGELSTGQLIALKIEGVLAIDNPTSNAVFKVNYYKDSVSITMREMYIGNKMDELNTPQHFEAIAAPTLNYAELDSITVHCFLGSGTSKLRELSYQFLKY